MASIVSFKLNLSKLRLVDFIHIYNCCQKRRQTIYICEQEKTYRIKRLPEMLSFLLCSSDKECLIVLEGNNVKKTKSFIQDILYASVMI